MLALVRVGPSLSQAAPGVRKLHTQSVQSCSQQQERTACIASLQRRCAACQVIRH